MEERAEEAAAAAPVDEEENGQGGTKKERINFLEGRSYIHLAQLHLELRVNDDQDEGRWSEIMN